MKFKNYIGLDEAGRGPLAGPVIAGAVFVKKPAILKRIILNDSKRLSPKNREKILKSLLFSKAILFGIGKSSQKEIDKLNIFVATKLAMVRALKDLLSKTKRKFSGLLIDGNFKIEREYFEKVKIKFFKNQIPIVKGDTKIPQIMIASIISKVKRDEIMERYSKIYPCYQFEKHKGYPTKLHKILLKKYGPCKIHRKSFKSVKGAFSSLFSF